MLEKLFRCLKVSGSGRMAVFLCPCNVGEIYCVMMGGEAREGSGKAFLLCMGERYYGCGGKKWILYRFYCRCLGGDFDMRLIARKTQGYFGVNQPTVVAVLRIFCHIGLPNNGGRCHVLVV